MGIKFLSYVPAILGVLSIGLFVFLNNPKDPKNRSFALLNLLTALWLASLFGADVSTNTTTALWFLRFALFFGALLFVVLFRFALVFPYKTKISRLNQFLLSLPGVVIAVLSLTPIVVSSVSIQSFGAQPENVGALYTLTDIISIFYVLAGAGILFSKFRASSSSREKNQVKFVLYGLSIALIANIATGLVLTLLQVETDLILFGGFSLFIFSLFVAYAIVKHGFLDIRPIIARTVAYLLLLTTLSGAFAVALFALTAIFFDDSSTTTAFKLAYLTVALIIAFLVPPLKRFFDQVTNKLFYRDAYDSQELLNNLNRSLVATIDLQELLDKSARIIGETLKSEYCLFAIKESQANSLLIAGSHTRHIEDQIIHGIADASRHISHKVIAVDNLETINRQLKERMQSAEVMVFVKLRAKTNGHGHNPGYILLGQKMSGGLYSPQDTQVLEIIADELVIAIQNALRFEEIKQFNITLQRKIEEATAELRHANSRLKELDKTKDEFISMASHQLRTPLTAVKGYLSMVLEGDVGPVTKEEKAYIKRAFDSAQKMVYLIADMLNVSRLQTGKFVIETKPTDLAEVVASEVDQLKEQAESRKQKLTYDKPAKFPILNLDETKIRQVVMNFIDNAIYYTPSGGTINVKLQSTDDSASFSVTDTGLGVPKSVQHHLFAKFYRADNARKARPDGTGLGLFMAKKVVVAQGGAIIFKSEEGKGSTFGFSFPLKGTEIKASNTESAKEVETTTKPSDNAGETVDKP